MRIFPWTLLLALSVAPALAKDVPLPPEATLRQGEYGKQFLDSMRYDAPASAYGKLKLCVAQVISNPSVTITGGTDPPFAFRSNARTQTSTIPGGPVFKYDDAATNTIIAVGSTDGGPTMLGMTHDVVRFELLAVAGPEKTQLTFNKIERATANTGSATNQGFYPVGAWRGAKPLQVVDALRALGNSLSQCL